MDILLLILLQVIFPVFTLIGTGVFLYRKLHLDINTMSKLATSVLMPAVAFVNIYESNIAFELFTQIIGFLVLQNLTLMLISSMTAKLFKMDRSVAATFKNSVVLNNSGNYGLSVSQLVFHNSAIGLSIQIIATIFQTIITHTYGLFNSVAVHVKGRKILLEFLKIPVFYALLLGLLLKVLGIVIPAFVWKPIENVSNAFFAMALFTLGAQVAYLKLRKPKLPLIMTTLGRLIVSPTIALLIIFGLGIEGVAAQALFIASSFPTSRNTALFALEYNNHPDYAAEAVLVTTLLSGVTVAVVVYLSKIIF
jgi:malate permease and related proteins